jgi:hypothetical protein
MRIIASNVKGALLPKSVGAHNSAATAQRPILGIT